LRSASPGRRAPAAMDRTPSRRPAVGNCPFCDRIARGEYDDAEYLWEVVSFEPLNPVTPGHRLFLPRTHALHPAPDEVGDAMAEAERWAKTQGEDFNLITSSGTAATQTVPHIHIHYVPRRPDDGLPLPWTGQEARRGE
ncbi:MAG: HIT family protein, partial [Dietzia sp.]|nr:HIT family protein [Dietzia sp.]